jgi:hypothetical protein
MDERTKVTIGGIEFTVIDMRDRPPTIEDVRERASATTFGKSLWASREANTCVSCGGPMNAEQFVDALSLKEAELSQLCQKCQDDVFREPPSDEADPECILVDGMTCDECPCAECTRLARGES